MVFEARLWASLIVAGASNERMGHSSQRAFN
jgi:hypothetical protein